MPARTAGGLLLIAVTVTLNALALFLPAIYSDAATYALISKNMALSGDWVNLMFMGQDWLDKPHFPFWITALSFTLFGVNAPAYLLPGLLFLALGAYRAPPSPRSSPRISFSNSYRNSPRRGGSASASLDRSAPGHRDGRLVPPIEEQRRPPPREVHERVRMHG
jgi:hypothetical protein